MDKLYNTQIITLLLVIESRFCIFAKTSKTLARPRYRYFSKATNLAIPRYCTEVGKR
jgi:hypothetical protein